jgi:tetratricopeptide (TPR) repeat protein
VRFGEHGGGDAMKDEAKRQLEWVKKKGQLHSHALAAEAWLRHYTGDTAGGIDALQRVLNGPDGAASGTLYAALGGLQLQAGDLDAARDALARAQKLAPSDARVMYLLAEGARRRGAGNESKALTLYDSALRLAPDHVPSLLGKALIQLDQGQLGDAGRRVARVLELGPAAASPRQLALAWGIQAALLEAQGKAAEATQAEQKALAFDSQSPDLYQLAGRRKARAGEADGALASFRKAIQLDPRRAAFYDDVAGVLLAKEGGGALAVQELSAAATRLPGNARLAKLLGDAYRSAGDADRARAQYERALEAERGYVEARIGLSRLWRDRKDWGRALDELDRAVKEAGSAGTTGAALAYVEMAEVELARGGKPEAITDLYTKALHVEPQNCAALWHLGKQTHAKGLSDDAKRLLGDYVRACPRGPRADEARRLVASLQ